VASASRAIALTALTALTRAHLGDLKVRNFKPKTIQGYANKLGRFTRWAESAGECRLQDFDSTLVKRYIAYLQTQRRWETHPTPKRTPQPPLADSAIRNYIRDLKPFATWLEEELYTAENVLVDVRKPKADETPIEPFPDEEIRRIFASLDPTDPFGLRDYVLLHTLWDTGLRVGELVALTLDDVDLQHCEIRVAHAKFGKWRDVGFGKQTHKYLTRYLNLARPPLAPDRRTHSLPSLPTHLRRQHASQWYGYPHPAEAYGSCVGTDPDSLPQSRECRRNPGTPEQQPRRSVLRSTIRRRTSTTGEAWCIARTIIQRRRED